MEMNSYRREYQQWKWVTIQTRMSLMEMNSSTDVNVTNENELQYRRECH